MSAITGQAPLLRLSISLVSANAYLTEVCLFALRLQLHIQSIFGSTADAIGTIRMAVAAGLV